ncbi:spermidine synthase [Micromonospora zhanjiangensis]|uniref:Spermidine synthase n=1 Tax=Micromonospora zhanjiangensis TaxID=1522057 RepID=A0ABV8KTL1_9ACTN
MRRPEREPTGLAVRVDSGLAALVPDPARPGGRILLLDGVEQSYVDVTDPTYLHFDYVRRMASVIDTATPAGAPLRALHLGAGGLTLPRFVAATRPGSTQRVVDRDAELVELVRRALPAPAGDPTIVIADARAAVESASDAGFDLVLGDVYRAARMPGHVATAQFAAQVARVLRPDGLFVVNLTDLPPLAFSRTQVATLRHVFADVCLIADRRMVRGRQHGNVVLAAARRAGRLPVDRLAARAARDPVPGRVLHGADLAAFAAGARPSFDPPA